LTRKLQAVTEDRDRIDRQLGQLQKLSEQMTTNFANLEGRFRALADAQQKDVQTPGTAPAQANPDKRAQQPE
jgi:hypothetical protein